MKSIRWVMGILFLAILVFPVTSQSTGTIESVCGVALVIGNAAYKGTCPLANPVNDALDMATAMEKLGWKVLR